MTQDSFRITRRELGLVAAGLGLSQAAPAAARVREPKRPVVYFSPEISERTLLAMYGLLQGKPSEKRSTGIKVHSTEAKINLPLFLAMQAAIPRSRFIETTWLDYDEAQTPKLASEIEAGLRRQGLGERPIDILNRSKAFREVPVRRARGLRSVPVPEALFAYDVVWDLMNFKAPGFSGFVGHIKNLGIAYVTSRGKQIVHRRGYPKDAGFFERLVDAAKGVTDALGPKLACTTILSDYRCEDAGRHRARNGRLGVLASADPVAADQASLDLIYGPIPHAEMDAFPMADKIRLGFYQLECAQAIGYGSRDYELVRI